jgi:hypothetical protein
MFNRETSQLDKIDMWRFPNAWILPKDIIYIMVKFWLNTKIGRKMFSKRLLSQELMTVDAFKWEWKFSQLSCPDQTRATVARESIKIIFMILQVYVKYNSYMIEWSKTKYSLRKKMQNNKEFGTSPAPLQYNFILLSRLTSTYKVKKQFTHFNAKTLKPVKANLYSYMSLACRAMNVFNCRSISTYRHSFPHVVKIQNT